MKNNMHKGTRMSDFGLMQMIGSWDAPKLYQYGFQNYAFFCDIYSQCQCTVTSTGARDTAHLCIIASFKYI